MQSFTRPSTSFGSPVYPGPTFVTNSVANLRLAKLNAFGDGAVVTTSGYTTAGDGGGGDYYIDKSDTSSADNGGSVIVSADGIRCKIITGDTLDIRRFGASTGSSDNSSAIQAAILYSENAPGITPFVFVPTGIFQCTSRLTLTSAKLVGKVSSLTRYTGDNQSVLSFTINPATYNEAILLNPTSNSTGQPAVTDLWLLNTNRDATIAKKTITGVTTRTSFTVAAADAPTVPTDPTWYPYYGYAFFYSPGGQYLGSAVMSNISTAAGTTTITLDSNYDWFATPTSGANKLTTSCTVVFAPLSTTVDPKNYPDPSRVGLCGIRLGGSGGLGVTVDNVGFVDFFYGLAFGITPTGTTYSPRLGNLQFTHPVFTGMGQCVMYGTTGAYDAYHTGIAYTDGFATKTIDIAIDNPEYRYTAFGFWVLPRTSMFDKLLSDGALVGLFNFRANGSFINQLYCDNVQIHGYYSEFGEGSASQGPNLNIANCAIGRPFSGNTALTRSNKYGIWANCVTGSGVNITNISNLQWIVGTKTSKFDYAFNLYLSGGTSTTRLSLGSVNDGTNNYTSLLAPSSGVPIASCNDSGSTSISGNQPDATGKALNQNAGTSWTVTTPKVVRSDGTQVWWYDGRSTNNYIVYGTGSTPNFTWTDSGKIGFGDYTGGSLLLNFQVRTAAGYNFGIDNSTFTGPSSITGSRISSFGDSPGYAAKPLLLQASQLVFSTDGTQEFFQVDTSGKIIIGKAGTAVKHVRTGTATLVAGTKTVTDTNITANSIILLTVMTAGGTQGFLSYTRSAGASFTINSTSGTETSVIGYVIVDP